MASSRLSVMPVRRVREAYEQVTDEIGEYMITGEFMLPEDPRALPRRTRSRHPRARAARAAWRCRASTTLPYLYSNINLLTQSEGVTLDKLFEVPAAARMAAPRLPSGLLRGHPRRAPGSSGSCPLNSDHRVTLRAVQARNEELAAEEMCRHLTYWRPMSERGLRHGHQLED